VVRCVSWQNVFQNLVGRSFQSFCVDGNNIMHIELSEDGHATIVLNRTSLGGPGGDGQTDNCETGVDQKLRIEKECFFGKNLKKRKNKKCFKRERNHLFNLDADYLLFPRIISINNLIQVVHCLYYRHELPAR
jgi:hypothetical protein